MNNAGVYTLFAGSIGAALSGALVTPITDLDGMSAVTLEAAFKYGAGGASCIAIVVTSYDGGTTWRHVARFDFGTANATKLCNLQANTAKAIAAYADLNAEGVTDGLLGDRLAVILTSTGTYSDTTLAIRAAVR
ncbi:hypothetical protein ACQR1Y_12190 [Bradyrhizobium sp. HKCCYLRH3099]|uniref:hypothetical protein n=1 Tax=unclassified Bradyrhizobium TaxID=2631580 RepID=UPI003EB89619